LSERERRQALKRDGRGSETQKIGVPQVRGELFFLLRLRECTALSLRGGTRGRRSLRRDVGWRPNTFMARGGVATTPRRSRVEGVFRVRLRHEGPTDF